MCQFQGREPIKVKITKFLILFHLKTKWFDWLTKSQFKTVLRLGLKTQKDKWEKVSRNLFSKLTQVSAKRKTQSWLDNGLKIQDIKDSFWLFRARFTGQLIAKTF